MTESRSSSEKSRVDHSEMLDVLSQSFFSPRAKPQKIHSYPAADIASLSSKDH